MSVFVSLVVSMLWKVCKQPVPNVLNTGSSLCQVIQSPGQYLIYQFTEIAVVLGAGSHRELAELVQIKKIHSFP